MESQAAPARIAEATRPEMDHKVTHSPRIYEPILDETGELTLSRYLSACLLRELQIALRLIGIRSRCQPIGHDDIDVPHLYLNHSELGWLPMPIVALPGAADGDALEWWFKLGSGDCVCSATNMPTAARIIADDLSEQS